MKILKTLSDERKIINNKNITKLQIIGPERQFQMSEGFANSWL